jgi:hypothetical protein
VIEHLPSKCKALRSNPSTTKKKKKIPVLQINKPVIPKIKYKWVIVVRNSEARIGIRLSDSRYF